MPSHLLDTNLLLRNSDPQSPNYPIARDSIVKLLARQESLYITPQNLIEFWAVATRPVAANGLGWDTRKTAHEVEAIVRQFPILPDSADVFPAWRKLVEAHAIVGKRTHDARLVAVALVHGVAGILTLNPSDFAAFRQIAITHPSQIA